MANPEHLKILHKGVESWNAWREDNPYIQPDLTDTDLSNKILINANLAGADIRNTLFNWARLDEARLSRACLRRCDLRRAVLKHTRFRDSNLRETLLDGADLTGAILRGANLTEASCRNTVFEGAVLLHTVFGRTDLTGARQLQTCQHHGPSVLDTETILQSGALPLHFLRGCGLQEKIIEALPTLLSDPIQRYSCFISYQVSDQMFVDKLHGDLQDAGVRCYLAGNDMKPGEPVRKRMDEEIRRRDRFVLVLSRHSIVSQWVEQEVETALEKERETGELVILPVFLDDAVMKTKTGWPAYIRKAKYAGDFRSWQDENAYKRTFQRLLDALKPSLMFQYRCSPDL